MFFFAGKIFLLLWVLVETPRSMVIKFIGICLMVVTGFIA